MNLASLIDFNLEEYGEYPATFFGDRWISNLEQADRTFRLCNGLRSVGVAPGDRVVVMLANRPEVMQSYGAVLRAGGVVVPVLFLLAAEELRLILSDSAAKAVITSPDFVSKVRDAAAGLDPEPEVIVVGEGPEGAISFEDLIGSQREESPVVDRADQDPALFMYTSGTTGRPKGVVLTHANLHHQAEVGHEISDFDREDIGLAALPMAHAGGLVGWVIGQKHGSRGVLLPWFEPDLFCRSIEEHKVAGTSLVPTMGALLLNYPGLDQYDLSSLEQVAFGASPVPAELLRAFEEKFGCKTRVVYGLTEAAPLVTIERLNEERREGSCGRAIPGVEVAIFDPDTDQQLPAGETGEICVRGPNVMAGYHNLPEETARTIRNGWLHTGDVGYLDEDGFMFVIDRVKDMIIRGGLNIYPRDVEEVLFAHPAVADAAVIGVPDPIYGEEVEAFVVKAYGTEVTEEDLLAYCRDRLAKYKAPKRITFMADLPKNQVGKVLKRQLRELAAKSRLTGESPDTRFPAPNIKGGRMATEKKSLNSPEETRTFDNGKVELAEVGGQKVGRATLKPGWKWSENVKPIAKTDSCQTHHVGYAVSGTLHVVHNDGTELDLVAGDTYEVAPGHDAWVVGDEPFVGVEFESLKDYAKK